MNKIYNVISNFNQKLSNYRFKIMRDTQNIANVIFSFTMTAIITEKFREQLLL